MTDTDQSEDDEVKEFNARLAAATTREEKLAVLRQYMDEDYAQFSLDWAMGENLEKYERHRPIHRSGTFTPEDLAEEAPPSAADAACQEEWRKVSTAQFRELLARTSMTSEPEAKLAVLRDYVSEAAAQYMIRRTLDKATGDAASAG